MTLESFFTACWNRSIMQQWQLLAQVSYVEIINYLFGSRFSFWIVYCIQYIVADQTDKNFSYCNNSGKRFVTLMFVFYLFQFGAMWVPVSHRTVYISLNVIPLSCRQRLYIWSQCPCQPKILHSTKTQKTILLWFRNANISLSLTCTHTHTYSFHKFKNSVIWQLDKKQVSKIQYTTQEVQTHNAETVQTVPKITNAKHKQENTKMLEVINISNKGHSASEELNNQHSTS